MSDITKLVDRGIPVNERTVSFTQDDASEGDVLLVQDSLGKHANKVTIEAGADMAVRFNVYRKVYPQRGQDGGLDADVMGLSSFNVSRGVQVKSDQNAVFNLAPSDVLEFDNDLPVKDIELVTVSGVFEITCM